MDPVVVATFTGPITAVGITLIYEAYRRSREEKLQLLRALVATRMLPSDPAFNYVMNSLPLVFKGSKPVLQAYAKYREHVAIQLQDGDPASQAEFVERARRLSTLIYHMTKRLGFATTEADVQRDGYISTGFTLRDKLNQDSQQALIRIAEAMEKNNALLERVSNGSNR